MQGNPQVIPYLSQGVLTESDAQALAAQAIADPNLARLDDRQVPVDGDQVAMANALESQRFVPGVTDFPSTPRVDHARLLRPDDVADRFAHSDVPAQPEVTSSSSGSTVEWNEALTAGIAALALGLGLGLAFGHLTPAEARRPLGHPGSNAERARKGPLSRGPTWLPSRGRRGAARRARAAPRRS